MQHTLDIHYAGQSLQFAEKAVIMIHGRGGTAQDIVQMASFLGIQDQALLAPQAAGNTWYPHSFMAPVSSNQPSLDSALWILDQTVKEAEKAGIATREIYFFGFSQGACLAMEYLARNAKRYGGAALIIGGLIGDRLDPERYAGDFGQTPVFIGTSNPDPHVPIARVEDSVKVLRHLRADVTMKSYLHAGHSILEDEIKKARQLIYNFG